MDEFAGDDADEREELVGLGLDIDLGDERDEFRSQQRKFAGRDLAAKHFDDTIAAVAGAMLIKALTPKQRVSRARGEVREKYGVVRRRGRLLGEDQSEKHVGNIDRARFEAAGLTNYTWNTMQDDDVRPEHEEREGLVFDWRDPPSGGHPGEAPRCRCWPTPAPAT